MYTEATLNVEYPKMKAALTRAINGKNPDKIIKLCEKTLARFEEIGFPDDWSRWERAKEDAAFSKMRNCGDWLRAYRIGE